MPYNVMWLRQTGNTGLTTVYVFLYQEHKKHRTKALHLSTASIKNALRARGMYPEKVCENLYAF